MPTFLIPLLRQAWPYLLIGALTLSTAYYRSQYQQAERNLEVFQTAVEMVGTQAAKRNKEITDAWKKNAALAWTGRNAALARLRESESAGSSRVPLSPPTAPGDSAICFEPAQFAAAVERFRSRVSGIVAQGEGSAIDARALLEAWPR